eukprot:CAMPEP_0194493230 /NCGR_PEP_ID=MMETSP0253-20130528/11516_1 /TAXON_ID=2966 /ORGANISM="Noctiluca scintillans" /LENGTH=116 /DNA_ID=CAMNT_0039334189 /DNA_START=94 /DNA_END=444 /DNA_ORIENTATION=-
MSVAALQEISAREFVVGLAAGIGISPLELQAPITNLNKSPITSRRELQQASEQALQQLGFPHRLVREIKKYARPAEDEFAIGLEPLTLQEAQWCLGRALNYRTPHGGGSLFVASFG